MSVSKITMSAVTGPIAHFPGHRTSPLEIVVGELYEVWLQHDWEEPRTCVPVKQLAHDQLKHNWEVLVDGAVRRVYETQIFDIGTATRPSPPITFPKARQVGRSTLINNVLSVYSKTGTVENESSKETT